jgi:hypothetical protein
MFQPNEHYVNSAVRTAVRTVLLCLRLRLRAKGCIVIHSIHELRRTCPVPEERRCTRQLKDERVQLRGPETGLREINGDLRG